MARLSIVAAGLAYLAALVHVTLIAHPQRDPAPNLVPLRTIRADLADAGPGLVSNFGGNLALFVPLGVLLPLLRRRTGGRHVALVALGSSAMIEGLQYLSGRRVADVDDVLLNTASGLIGYGGLAVARWAVAPSPAATTPADGPRPQRGPGSAPARRSGASAGRSILGASRGGGASYRRR